jgi:hypothetical protein
MFIYLFQSLMPVKYFVIIIWMLQLVKGVITLTQITVNI